MTAETDLLPLPDAYMASEFVHNTFVYGADQMQAYARACVSSATEALRAEVDRLQGEIDNRWAMGVHTCHENCQRHSCVQFRRAELLAEALRGITEVYAAMRETLEQKYPQDGWSANTMTLDAARAALDQETTNG